jgi:hypothetical protein
MTSGRIFDERSAIVMLIQLADTAAAARERGDNLTLERALRGISRLRTLCFEKQQFIESLFRLHELGPGQNLFGAAGTR